MRPAVEAKVFRSSSIDPVAFGPLSEYRKMTGDDGLPVFTGIQTCKPGYATPLHWHPYTEYLFILEGTMEAWLEGEEAAPAVLRQGDMIVLPASKPHKFRNGGDGDLRLMGIHTSPVRIVHVVEAA